SLERPLRSREVMAVGLALDDAIEASVGMYVSNREEYVRGVERERTDQEKRAKEALQRWEQVFHHAGWGVAITDPESNTLQAVNLAFARMHGYEVGELLGRPLADTIAPESRSELEDHFRVAHEQGRHVYESVHLRRDGTRFPVQTDVTAFRDEAGRVLYRAANFQDITEHKRL